MTSTAPVCSFKSCRNPGLRLDISQFRICTGCSTAKYCSQWCQQQDWRRHMLQCYSAALPRAAPAFPSRPPLLDIHNRLQQPAATVRPPPQKLKPSAKPFVFSPLRETNVSKRVSLLCGSAMEAEQQAADSKPDAKLAEPEESKPSAAAAKSAEGLDWHSVRYIARLKGVNITEFLLEHCVPAQRQLWEKSRDSLRCAALPADENAARGPASAADESKSASGAAAAAAAAKSDIAVRKPSLQSVVKELAVDFFDRHPQNFDASNYVF